MPPEGASVLPSGKHSKSHLRLPATTSVVIEHPTSALGAPTSDLPENLAAHPLFSPALAHYLRDCYSRRKHSTRLAVLRVFRVFWTFLADEEAQGRIYDCWTEVDDGFTSRLIAWMSNSEKSRNVGLPTKALRYNTLRAFFDWLKYDRFLLPADWVIRHNPWPLSYRHNRPREALPDMQLQQIVKAALSEVEVTIAGWEYLRSLVDDPSVLVPDPSAKISAYKQEAIALKSVAIEFPSGLIAKADLKQRRKGLSDAFRTYKHLSLARAAASITPTPRQLVPFILLIALATLFNPDTVLGLKLTNIDEEHPVFGKERWRLNGQKARAGRLQRRSFPARVKDLTNPVILLRLLRAQTDLLRPYAPVSLRDHIFIFRLANVSHRVGTFVTEMTTSTWGNNLRNFITDNHLEPFTLGQIRPTGADLIDAITRGDVKAQQTMLNHSTSATLERHYTSASSRQRRAEQLAHAMGWRERYIGSNGKIDSRGKSGPGRAATPGYECFDPFDSPIQGQTHGQLCTAFGICPACPMHALDPQSPTTLARIVQLDARLDEARAEIAMQRWLTRWKPVKDAVGVHIRLFDNGLFEEARKLSLPPLPEVE